MTTNTKTEKIHPGQLVLEKMNLNNITFDTATFEFGLSSQELSNIIEGKQDIYGYRAEKIARMLPDTTKQYWIDLQDQFYYQPIKLKDFAPWSEMKRIFEQDWDKTSYPNDFLKHDKKWILNYGDEGDAFWTIGECGTHLCSLTFDTKKDSQEAKILLEHVRVNYSHNNHYVINKTKIKQIGKPKLIASYKLLLKNKLEFELKKGNGNILFEEKIKKSILLPIKYRSYVSNEWRLGNKNEIIIRLKGERIDFYTDKLKAFIDDLHFRV